MSQIDEAFIQAYASSQQPTAAPQGAVPIGREPIAGLHSGPHIPLQPAVEQPPQQQVKNWAPEPIPAPHFHAPSSSAAPMMEVSEQIAQSVVAAAGGAATQRRPLSAFAAPEQPATTAFEPVFEVDAFRWPAITTELLDAHYQLLLPVVEQLVEGSEQGRSLVGITGSRGDVGCTTIQLCLARLIANAGKSVALVDANFAEANLARDLGLEFESGWEDVLAGRMPLAECVVKSLEDRMALLPLARPSGSAAELLSSIQTSVTAGVLRYHYDVVLFNLGAAGQMPQWAAAQSVVQHCRLDASIIVADTAMAGEAGAAQIDPLIALLGSSCLGVIGNYAAANL